MVADSYGQWQGFANQQDQIAASNYFASIQAAQRARQIAAEEEARKYSAWVESQRYAQQRAEQQAMEAERQREWTSEFGLRKSTGEQNLDLTRKFYNWQMTKPDERVAALKDHAMSVALNMVQQGFTPDIAAQATGLDETSYDRTAPVYNFLAKQSKEEADQADALAKSLNAAQKTIKEAEDYSAASKVPGAKSDTAKLMALTEQAKAAQRLIQQYGTNPRWSGWVAFDEDVNRYIPRKKALPEFKWKTGNETTTESDTAATPAQYEPETAPADMSVTAATLPDTFWNRRYFNRVPIVATARGIRDLPDNGTLAVEYAGVLLARHPEMTKAQATREAYRIFPF